MLFKSLCTLLLVLISLVFAQFDHDYHLFPVQFDEAIARIQTAGKMISQNLTINLDDNLFSPNMWGIVADSLNSSLFTQELTYLFNGTQRKDMWAMKLIDAWGKPWPSSILVGNLYWVGNYDECLNPLYQITNKSFLQEPFTSQYCEYSAKTRSSH